MAHKTIIFFIDGGTWELLLPWMEQGQLPHFKQVYENGVSGVMQSTVPPSTVPAIQSFTTGRNPGQLGIFNVIKPDGSVVSFNDVKEKTMWEVLGEHGYESLVTELPTTYPPRPFKGRMITGFLTPSRESSFTWPPELKDQLGDYPAGLEYDHSSILKHRDDRQMLDSVIAISHQRFQTFMRLYREQTPDFAIFYVKSTDVLGHLLWDKRDLLVEYYKLLDVELGEMLRIFGHETNFIITSDHGFEDAATHGFYINTWLTQHGYYPVEKNRGGLVDWLDRNKKVKHFLKKVLRLARYDLAAGKRKRAESVEGALAWFDTIVPIGIRVSPKAPAGTIERIIETLKAETFEGKPVFRIVAKREELFSGQYVNMAPEIIILPERQFMIYGLREGDLVLPLGKRTRKGDHNAAINAIFMAAGPAIKARRHDLNVKIYDVFATIMELYGIKDIEHDGEPIPLK